MGLTNFKGELPRIKDIGIAKNYLTEDELKVLNNLVSGFFDFAEIQAIKKKPMYMKDYIRQLDAILSSTGEQLLDGAGKISHQQAIDKAQDEYRKFQVKTLTEVEKSYLETIKSLETKVKNSKDRSNIK